MDRSALWTQGILISFVVPMYHESEHIRTFLETLQGLARTLGQDYEIIAIDDGSLDDTFEQFKCATSVLALQAHALRFSRNFGKEMALSAGLEHAKGDVAVLLDADLQHPLEMVPKFLEQWRLGYDMVYGVQQERQHEPRIMKAAKSLFYRLLDRVTKTHIPPHAGDFRLLDRKVIDAINRFEERGRFMKGLYAWVGFKSLGLPFDPPPSLRGRSHFKLRPLTELAITGITSFSSFPLRIWCFLGALVSIGALGYGAYVIVDTLRHGNSQPGFATLASAICLLGGIQLISIGVLGEYIDRIFNEVKRRPPYLVAETYHSQRHEHDANTR